MAFPPAVNCTAEDTNTKVASTSDPRSARECVGDKTHEHLRKYLFSVHILPVLVTVNYTSLPLSLIYFYILISNIFLYKKCIKFFSRGLSIFQLQLYTYIYLIESEAPQNVYSQITLQFSSALVGRVQSQNMNYLSSRTPTEKVLVGYRN